MSKGIQVDTEKLNTQRIDLSKIDSIIEEQIKTQGAKVKLYEDVYVSLEDTLTLEDIALLADKVADICVSDFGYSPEYREPFALFYILENVSNFPLKFTETDGAKYINTDWMFALYKSRLGQDLLDALKSMGTIKHLFTAIDEKIEYRKNLLRVDFRVTELLNKFGKAIDNVEHEFTEMANTFNVDKQSESLNAILEKFNELDPEKLKFIEDVSKFNTGKGLNEFAEEQKNNKVVSIFGNKGK